MVTISRYAVATEPGPDFPPLREVADWSELEDDTTDPRAVELAFPAFPGKWLLSSCQNPLADMAAQITDTVFNRFGEITDPGGHVIGSMDLYRLPLLPGYRLATEDEYVAAFNAAADAVPGTQRIPTEV